jgi:hypothetical protein
MIPRVTMHTACQAIAEEFQCDGCWRSKIDSTSGRNCRAGSAACRSPEKRKAPLEGMSRAFGSSAEAATFLRAAREEDGRVSLEAEYLPRR